MTDHDNVYEGLLGGDDSQWAFGSSFEDPLAGVDTTIASGVDAATLAAYRPELRGTPQAREAISYLLFKPPLPLAARAPYAVLVAAAVAMMPRWTRRPSRGPCCPDRPISPASSTTPSTRGSGGSRCSPARAAGAPC